MKTTTLEMVHNSIREFLELFSRAYDIVWVLGLQFKLSVHLFYNPRRWVTTLSKQQEKSY